MKRYIATGLSLPAELMKWIDTERGDISRSRYVLRIIEKLYMRECGKRINRDSLDRRFETLQSSEPLKP
jgi:hypothetical protein